MNDDYEQLDDYIEWRSEQEAIADAPYISYHEYELWQETTGNVGAFDFEEF